MKNNSSENLINNPEEDIIIFNKCKRKGDFKHGIFHLACAIASNPQNQVWLGYLDDLIKTTRDSLSLIPLDQEGYFAVAAVKAYIYAATGEYNQAFRLLNEVINVKPEIPYVLWGIRWIDEAKNSDINEKRKGIFKVFYKKSAPRKIESEIIISFICVSINRVGGLQDDLRSKTFNAFSRILNAMTTTCSNNYLLFWILSAVQRRQNELVLAMENAQKAYNIKKCWQTAVGVALAFKSQENIEESIKYYEIATRLDPKNATAYLDIGDIYLLNSNYIESANAYKRAIAVDKDNNWAIPSLYFCEFMINRDIQWHEKLNSYNKDNPENQQAKYLLDLINNMTTAAEMYIDYIPDPTEASIDILNQIIQEMDKVEEKSKDNDEGKSNSITLTISYIEAPSVLLAFELSMRRYFHKSNPLKIKLIVENIQEPDPRKAIKDVYPLPWKYDGIQPKFCDNLPGEEIIDAVNSLAVEKYNLESWYEKAKIIANRLMDSSVPDLFSVMVHPTMPPENFTPLAWVQRVQFAAVFILAHIQKHWTVDPEKNLLLAICYGPLDWPVTAAIIVLTYMANENIMIQDDIIKVFCDLMKRIPRQGYCFYTYALVINMLRLSSVDGEFKEELLQWKKELEFY